VTQARDVAEARRKLAAAKLAKAEADRMRIDVAKRTLEAAEKATQKAEKGVGLGICSSRPDDGGQFRRWRPGELSAQTITG
jgi:hypothetical protein